MTGRPKGAKATTKNAWLSTCLTCGASVVNCGSGRAKKYCNAKCKERHPTTLARKRAYTKRRYWKDRIPADKLRRENNREILVKEKLRRGECELHQFYNNGERKFVVPGLEYLFDMDHLDRHHKHKTIAKMMTSPEKRFRDEMAKCQMLCVECHRRKTVENKDWVQIVKVLEPEMAIVYNQPTLFDN